MPSPFIVQHLGVGRKNVPMEFEMADTIFLILAISILVLGLFWFAQRLLGLLPSTINSNQTNLRVSNAVRKILWLLLWVNAGVALICRFWGF